MTLNTVLTDKNGNPLAPATTAEQVAYNNEMNVKQAIDAQISQEEAAEIKEQLDGLNGKIMPYIDYEIPGGGSVQIKPSITGFYYLVLLRASTSVNYAAIILTGYGTGDIRYKYKKLDDGNIKTVEVSGQSFILSMNTEYNDETQLRLYVLLGDIPNIV